MRGMHYIHSGGFSHSSASKRCDTCRTRYIFSYNYTQSFKMLCGTANVPLFSRPAFVIDCVRCHFRARNALHSFKRHFTPARKRCRSCRPRYIFSYSCTRSFKILCGHGKCSAFFHARPSSLTAEDAASVRGMRCIHSGCSSRLLTSKRCRSCCTRYIFLYICMLYSKRYAAR